MSEIREIAKDRNILLQGEQGFDLKSRCVKGSRGMHYPRFGLAGRDSAAQLLRCLES